MFTINGIASMKKRGLNLLRQEWRRAVSFVVAFTFMFTMTGLDAIIAHAYDDYKQYSGAKLEVQRDALMTGTNPADNASPDAFVDMANPESLANPASTALSDTSLNVLKSEYGSLLDTVSLQTLAERAGGGDITALVNEAVGQPETALQPRQVQPDAAQPAATVPLVDPATAADIVTLQTGPLGMSLEMEGADPASQIPTTDNKDLARLPMPAGALRENLPTAPVEKVEVVEPEVPVVEAPKAQEPQLAAVPGTPDVLQNNVLPTTNNLPVEDQTLPDPNQVQVPEENQPDQPEVTLPKDQQPANQNADANKNGNLSQQFIALLGLTPNVRTETATLPQAENGQDQLVDAAGFKGDQGASPKVVDQNDKTQTVKPQAEPVVKEDGKTLVPTDDGGQPQPEQTLAKNPDQQPNQKPSGEVLPGQEEKPGGQEGDQEGDQTQKPTNLLDQWKAMLDTDVTTPDRTETNVVETTGAEDIELPEIAADNLLPVKDAQPAKDVTLPDKDAAAPKVEVASKPDVVAPTEDKPDKDKKPTETDVDNEEGETEGGDQSDNEDMSDQVLNMLVGPVEEDGGPESLAAPETDLDITLVDIDLPAPEITSTTVLGADTVRIDVNALLGDQTLPKNEVAPVENLTPSPVLADAPRVEQPTVETNTLLLQNDQPVVQNTQVQQNDQVGICMVGPDSTLQGQTDVSQPVEVENGVKAASMVVQPDATLRDPAQAKVNPLATNNLLSTNAGYTQINNQANNMIASLPNAINQGGQVITNTTTFNATLQAALTIPTVRPTIQPATVMTQPQLGMATYNNSMMYDVNMMNMGYYNLASSMPAPGTIGQVVPAGSTNNIVTMLGAVAQATSNPNYTIPPRPTVSVTNNVLPWSTYAPMTRDDAPNLGVNYRSDHQHMDPKSDGGGEASGCAKFFASPLGKILMFAVTVVLTIFTVGTAAPILLAIMIILEAILTFVPLPPALALTLGIALVFVGGWASALNSLATTAAAVGNITVQQAMTQLIANAGGLIGTLAIKEVGVSILKAVIAKVIVDVFLILCPEASPIQTALVAIAAGILAGGMAEMMVNGKGLVEAFKFSLKEPLAGFFEGKAMQTIGTLLTSPLALQIYQVVLEEAVVRIMVAGGYTETYARQIGSFVAALSVGALGAATNNSTVTPTAVKWIAQFVVQPLATALSTWYSTEVGGLLQEQGYSSIQTMHFAQTLSSAVNLFSPTMRMSVNKETGKSSWVLTMDAVVGFNKLMGNEKTDIIITRGAEEVTQKQLDQKAASGQPPVANLDPPVKLAMETPGLAGTAQSAGIRQQMPENGQLVAQPVLRQGMTEGSLQRTDTAPVVMPAGNGGIGTGMGVVNGATGAGTGLAGTGAGLQPGGVMAAANVGVVAGPEGMTSQGVKGVVANVGDVPTNLYSPQSPVSALQTDMAKPVTAETFAAPVQKTDTSLPTNAPESIKPTDVQMAAPQKVEQPIEQSVSNPKPSNVPDTGGESTSKPSTVETNKPATDTKIPDLKPNTMPDNTAVKPDAPTTSPQQTAAPEIEAPKTETAAPKVAGDSDTGRNLSGDAPRMDESKPGTSQQADIKDLKAGDALKYEDPTDKASKGGDVTTANAAANNNGGQTEEVSKNNNRIMEKSGAYSDAFVPRDPAQSPSPIQASGSSNAQPAEVQGLVQKLQDSYIMPKNENYSYSQTQNAKGQTLTQVYNGQGQVIGAQVDLGNGTQITKTFDYQPAPKDVNAGGATAAPGAAQVTTRTMVNGNYVEQQVANLEGGKLNVVDTKRPMDATGLNSSHAPSDLKASSDTIQRREGELTTTGSDTVAKGTGSQTATGNTAAKGGDVAGTEASKPVSPAEGTPIKINEGTPDKPVNINMEFHKSDVGRQMNVEGSDGNTYRVTTKADGTGEVLGRVEVGGSFWSFSPREEILIPKGQTTGYGNKGNVYDCSGGEPRLIKENTAATFTDSQGKTVQMSAPVSVEHANLPKEVQQALVMLDNLNRTAAGNSNLALTELQKTEMAAQVANVLQQHAGTQPQGGAGYKQAMEFTYQAEQRLYSQTASQQLLTQMSEHALQSGNPQLMMNAADLQLKAGQTTAGMNSLQQAMSNAGGLSAGQQASLQMSAANLLQTAGQTKAFQQSMGEVANYLNSLQGQQASPEALALALQYDSLARKAQTPATAGAETLPDMSKTLTSLSQGLDQRVNQAGTGLLVGQQRQAPELNGTVVRTQNGYNLLQAGANDTMVTTQFNQNGASRIEVKPATGGEALQVYQQVNGAMKLTDQQTTVQTTVEINGQKQTRVVEALLPVDRPVTNDNPTGAVQKLLTLDGQNYTMTVGKDNTATSVLSHVREADGVLNYQQKLPQGKLELNADNTATFRTASGEAVTLQGKTLTTADVDAMGIKGAAAAELVGKMAFTLTRPGTGAVTFVGSAADIKAGNYTALSTNQLSNPTSGQPANITLAGQFRGNNLVKITLGDQFQTTIEYKTADLSKFTVTRTSEDGMQIATFRYENNQLQSREVVHKAFGVTFQCDANGNLTAASKKFLQENSGKGYTYRETSNEGFSLINNQTKVEQAFSANGRMMLNQAEGGTPGGAQKIMEFDVKQITNLQVAKLDNGAIATQNVRFEQITQQVVILQESNGLVVKTVLKSDVAGVVHEREITKANQVMTETGTFKTNGEFNNGTRTIQTTGVIQQGEKGTRTIGDMAREETVANGITTSRTTDITNRAILEANGVPGTKLPDVHVQEKGLFTPSGEFVHGERTTTSGKQVVTENGRFDTATGNLAEGTRKVNEQGLIQTSRDGVKTIGDMNRTETVKDGIVTSRTTDITNRANLNADNTRGTALDSVNVREKGTFTADGEFVKGVRVTTSGRQVVTENGVYNAKSGDLTNGTRNVNSKGMVQTGKDGKTTVSDMNRTETVKDGLVTSRTTDVTNRAQLNADGTRTKLDNVNVKETGTFTADGEFVKGVRVTTSGRQVVTENGVYNAKSGELTDGSRNVNSKGVVQTGRDGTKTIGDMNRTETVKGGVVTDRTTDVTNRASLNANGTRGAALDNVNVREKGIFNADGEFVKGTRVTTSGNQVVTENGSYNAKTGDLANGVRNVNAKGVVQTNRDGTKTVGDMNRTETVKGGVVTNRTTDITNRAQLNADGTRTKLDNVNVRETGTFNADGEFLKGVRTTTSGNQIVRENGSYNAKTGDLTDGIRDVKVKDLVQTNRDNTKTIGNMNRTETVEGGVVTSRTTDVTNRANLNANGTRGTALDNVNVREKGTFNADGEFLQGTRTTVSGSQTVTENGSYNAKTGDLMNGTQEVLTKQQVEKQGDLTTTNSGVASTIQIKEGKIVDINTTIQSSETRNASGQVVGRESGIKKAILEPVFDEAGTLVSGKQIMRVNERVEIDTETGNQNVSRDVVSRAKIEQGRVVESRTQIGESFTRNSDGRVISESQFNVIQNFKMVSVYTPGVFGSDAQVGINITQAKGGSTVVINGNQENAVSMGEGVTVRAEGNKIIVEDARGVLKTFDPRGNETTGRWQSVKNSFNEYVDKINVAWEGLAHAWKTEGLGSALLATGGWALKVTAAFTVFVLQEAWYAVEGTVALAINVVTAPVTLLYTAGKNLINGNPIGQGMMEAFNAPGNGVVNGIKSGLNFVFGYVDKGLNYVSQKLVSWSDKLLNMAENLEGTPLGRDLAIAATALRVLGENLPTLVIIGVSFIPYVGAAIAITMLARDALNRGLGHMFQSFFIDPVVKIATGINQLFNINDSSPISATRQAVNAMSLIGSGVIGLALAKMMLKQAITEFHAARGEVALAKVASHVKDMASLGKTEGLIGKTLGEIARDAGLKVKGEPAWAGIRFGDLVISKMGTTISQLVAKPGGIETLANFLTNGAGGKGFRINDLSLPNAKAVETSRVQQLVEKISVKVADFFGKKLELQKPTVQQSLGEVVKPSQVGLNPLTGMGAGFAAFAAGTIKSQFTMMYHSFKSMGSMATSVLRGAFNGARSLVMEGMGLAYSPAYQRASQAVGQVTQRIMATKAGQALQSLSPANMRGAYNRVVEAARNFSFSQFRSSLANAFRQLTGRLTQTGESVRLANQIKAGAGPELAAARQGATEAALKGEAEALPKPQTLEEASTTGKLETARTEVQGEVTMTGARQGVVAEQPATEISKTAGTEPTTRTTGDAVAGSDPARTGGDAGVKGAAVGGVPKEGTLTPQAQAVKGLEGNLTQMRAQLTEARQNNNTAEVGRLTEAIRTNEANLAQAKTEARIADLEVIRSRAEADFNDPSKTALERQQAATLHAEAKGQMLLEQVQADISKAQADIARTEARLSTEPQAKAELSAQRTKLAGLQEQKSLIEQAVTNAQSRGQARMDQLRLQGELADANARLDQARTPEEQRSASTSIRRIEREMDQAKAVEKYAQTQQRVQDCLAEVAKARAEGDVQGVIREQLKLNEAYKESRYSQIELTSAQVRLEQAQARENQFRMSGQLDQMAQASGVSRQALEAKVDQMVKDLGPKNQRQALKEALVDLMSGNSRNPLRAMEILQQNGMGMKAFMDAMLANGLRTEAGNFLDQVGKAQGANIETLNAAAEAFNLPTRSLEGELGRQFGDKLRTENPEGVAKDGSRTGMNQAERSQMLREVADNLTLEQYDRLVKAQVNGENITDVLKAMRTEGAGRSLAEVLGGDPAARAKAFADQLSRTLSDAGVDMNASRRQAVEQVAKNLTLEGYTQLRESLLQSTDPMKALEQVASKTQPGTMPAKVDADLATERLLGGEAAKMESSYTPETAKAIAKFVEALGTGAKMEEALRTNERLANALDKMTPEARQTLLENLTQAQALQLVRAEKPAGEIGNIQKAQEGWAEGRTTAESRAKEAESRLTTAKEQADAANKALEEFRAQNKTEAGKLTPEQAARFNELQAASEAANKGLADATAGNAQARKALSSYEQAPLQQELGGRSSQALAALQRLQQVEAAQLALHQAKMKYNQATTYAEKVAAEKAVQNAQRQLRITELLAESKPAMGNRITEAWARWRTERNLATADRVQLRINVSEAVSAIKDPTLRAQVTEQLLRFNDLQKAIETDQAALSRAGRFGGNKTQIEARMMENIKQRQNLLAEINKSGNVDRLLESMELQSMTSRGLIQERAGGADTSLGAAIKDIIGNLRGELLQPKELAKAVGADEALIISLCERIGQTSELLNADVVRKVLETPEFSQLRGRGEDIIKAMELQIGAKFQFPALGEGMDAVPLSERRSQIETMLKESALLKNAGVELNAQSRAIITELIIRFQADPNYRFFTPELPMFRFLARQAELHYMNMELQIKNPAMKAVIGEALQLAMGGGKSCSPIALKVALDLFVKNHGGNAAEAPAMLYMTANATLVKQIIKDNPVFKQMNTVELAKEGTPEQMAEFKKVVENGFEKGKMYVTDNETLKQVVLEMRSNGKSDAQIAKLLQRDLGTVAWDEFHAAFHTTDTIIGASGIVPHLSPASMQRLMPVTLNLLTQYARVREWFNSTQEYSQGRARDLFVNAEQGVGREIRAQFRFTEAAKEAIYKAGILDYRNAADAFVLDKIAQTLSMTNGNEYFGKYNASTGRTEYGTMEGGMGKPNTIFGDQMLATFTNAEIFLEATKLRSSDLLAENFTAQYRPFMECMIEAFVHTTTERVTMMEAMHLVGAHNIVGFSGTFEGIQNVLTMWGKQLVRVNSEPVIDLMQVTKYEAYFRVKVGEDVLTLIRDTRTGEVKLTLGHESLTANTALVNDILHLTGQALAVRDAAGKTIEGLQKNIRQQIVTGTDNIAMGRLMGEVDAAYSGRQFTTTDGRTITLRTQQTEISVETVRKFLVENGIEVPRKADVDMVEALFQNDALATQVIAKMIQHPGGEGMVHLIRIDGVKPELYTYAMKALEAAIKTPEGCQQLRVVFAPKVSEGLNTVSIKQGIGMETMGAALHQLDMRPLDVYRQTMKRLNVTAEINGLLDYRRAQGLTGMTLDYNALRNILGSEVGEMSAFVEAVRAQMGKGTSLSANPNEVMNRETTDAAAKLMQRFNDMLVGEGRVEHFNDQTRQTSLENRNYSGRTETGVAKTILNEVDTQKARAAQQTQAGIQTEATTDVGVSKTSAEYMPTLAKHVESRIPEILRKFQGLSDLTTTGSTAGLRSQLMQSPAMTPSALRSHSQWSLTGWIGNFVDSRISSLQTSSSKIQLVNEYSRTWQSAEWQQQNPQAVASLQQQFGSNWFEPAMTAKFGTDWKLYQKLGTALAIQTQGLPKIGALPLGQAMSNFVAAIMVNRQLHSVPKQEYQAAVRNITRVAEQLPRLVANPQTATLTYQGQTMNLPEAQRYLRQQMDIVNTAVEVYGFKSVPYLTELSKVKEDTLYFPRELSAAASETLRQTTPAVRLMQSLQQRWDNTLRHMQQNNVLSHLFKVENGKVVPSMPTRVIVSVLGAAAAIGVLTFAGLPITGMVIGGLAISGVMTIVMGMSFANKATAAQGTLSRGGVFNLLTKYILPVGMAVGGLMLANPVVAATGISQVSSSMAMSSLNARTGEKDIARITYRQQAAAETAGVQMDASQQVQGGKSLVETWKQEMQGLDGGEAAYGKLQDVMGREEFGQVRLSAAEVAQRYGYMHLLAAVFSLVPKALESVSTVEVGLDSIQAPENVVGAKDVSRVRVDKGSVRFLDQRFSDLLVTQAVMAMVERVFTDAERVTLNAKLRQSGQFAEYGDRAVVEFVKQYLMDGAALKAWMAEAAGAQQGWSMMSAEVNGQPAALNLYELVRQRLGGKEYTEADLAELNQAMGELENEAVPLMAEAAKQIQAEPAANQAVRQAEFLERFGVEYGSYLAMVKPSLLQRVLLKVAGEEQLQGEQPVGTVRKFSWQMAGVGLAAAAVGVVGILTGMLPAIAGAAAALTGAAVVVAGLWTLLRAQNVAFGINPAGAIAEQMRQAGFKSEQDLWAAQNHYNTLNLLENREFSQAVSGLRIKGTEHMLSEQNRGRAVRAVVGQMVRVMESDAPQDLKLQLTRELTQVLGYLQFNFSMQVRQNGPALTVTLTPEAQPQALKQDYKLGRLVQRLEGLGISINLEVAPPLKQPKLKLTGAAA